MKAQLLASAKVGKTHGVDGYLRVYSLSGEDKHLKKLSSCTIRIKDGKEFILEVDSTKKDGDLFLMKFRGYSSPEKARNLSQSILYIPREAAPKLKKGEYYVADLYNMDVMVKGEHVGVVIDTFDGPQSLMLCVKKDSDNKTYLVPNLSVYVENIDIEKNSLELIAPFLLEG